MKTNSNLIRILLAKGWKFDSNGNLTSPSQTTAIGKVEKESEKAKPAKRKKAGEMNLTEKRFFENYINPALLSGKIIKCDYENVRLKLAAGTTYTPDFQVVTKDGKIEFHEIKNRFAWEDAIIKFKWAKEEYPEFKFYFVQYDRDTGWKLKYGENDSSLGQF